MHRAPIIAASALALLALAACNQSYRRNGPAAVNPAINPWFAAATSNDPALLSAAATTNADPNAHETRDYSTPLHIAATAGNTDAIRVLLAAGAKPNALDEDGRTPLMLACHRLRTPAALALIAAPTDLALSDRQRQTALMFAARQGDLEIVRAMIAANAPLNAQRADGWTALHLAARQGHADIARALKQAGANPTLPDRRGRTAIDVANASRNRAVADILIDG